MNYSPQKFAEDTGVSSDLAKRVIDLLDERDMDPTELNTLLWKMRDFAMKSYVPELLEQMEDDEINSLIDQMVMDKAMWDRRCPTDVCCSETPKAFEEALYNADLAIFCDLLCEEIVDAAQFMPTGRGSRKPVSAATKKKISDALKEFYKGSGGKVVSGPAGRGKAVTVDTKSPEQFLKTIAGIPKDVIDAAKGVPSILSKAAKTAVQEIKDTPELIKQVAQGKIKLQVPQRKLGRSKYMKNKKRAGMGTKTGTSYLRGRPVPSAVKNNAPESAWFFTAIGKKEQDYKEGDVVTIQIFRTGEWEHPGYGKVIINKDVIDDVVSHFNNRTRRIDLAVDENHEENHKALGWFREVYSEDDGEACYAKIELTRKGAELLNEGAYKYFSPEIVFNKVDEESGESQSNLLIGGAFTNRPFFKGMQPLMATEGAAINGKEGSALQKNAYFFSHKSSMHKLLMLLDNLVNKDKISAAEKAELEKQFNEIPKEDRTKDLSTAISEVLAKFEEEGSTEEAETVTETETTTVTEEAETETEEEETKEEGSTTEEGVTANEDGSFTVSSAFMDKLKKDQKNLSQMTRDATLRACETEVRKYCFSEKTPGNVVLPKDIKKISVFAAGLKDPQKKAFFDIIGSLKAVQAGQIGHGSEAKVNFNDPKTIPESHEVVRHFMEKMGQDLETAQRSAADYLVKNQK